MVTLNAELQRLESKLARLKYDLTELESQPVDEVVIPTADELRERFLSQFKNVARDSPEFSRLMRCIIPKIVVFPCRRCDGNKVVLRARFRLHLEGLLPDRQVKEMLSEQLERTLDVDLFEPCQRAKFRERVVAMRASVNPQTGRRYTYLEIGPALGITDTAAQYAAELQREMDKLGIDDPYIPITKPPEDGKLKRHLNPRYSFEPLEQAGVI